MKTRERIKQTATALFNEKGATNVSTVQIADCMGISPGNLYYYFTNKEHIIRCIWEEDMVPQNDHIYLDSLGEDPVASLSMIMEGLIGYVLKYPFFYTEQYTIFKNDPLLQKLYRERWDRGVEIMTDTFVLWQEKGYMRPSSRAWKRKLVEYFLAVGPAFLRSNLSIHPEYSITEALKIAGDGVLLIVSGDFVDEICDKLITKLKG